METKGLVTGSSFLTTLNQIAGHIDESRFLRSSGLKDAGGGLAAVHDEAAGGKVQIAEKEVIAGALEKGESFLSGRGAIHAQAVGGEAFLKKHPEAFFVVENEHRAAPEKTGHCWN